jgi:hypothetical protein
MVEGKMEGVTWACPWSHELRPKRLYASVVCHQLLSRFIVSTYLPQVTHLLQLSNDNEMKVGVVYRFTSIYSKAVKKPGKSQLQNHLKTKQPFLTWNGGPYFQMKLVGSHKTSWRRKVPQGGITHNNWKVRKSWLHDNLDVIKQLMIKR